MSAWTRGFSGAALGAAMLLLTGCPSGDANRETAAPGADAIPQPPPPPDMRLEVDVPSREVRVFRNDQQIAAHPVAVGREEWPTRPGEWHIGQVVFNPRWVPPAEEWAEDEDPVEPGDPENPLGRVQLVYDAPRSIHGTNDPQSIGQAVSHGSIRVTNEAGFELARLVMDAGGASRDEGFFRQVQEDRTRRVEVPIPNPIPIRVVNPGFDEAAAERARAAERGGTGTPERTAGAGAATGARTPAPGDTTPRDAPAGGAGQGTPQPETDPPATAPRDAASADPSGSR